MPNNPQQFNQLVSFIWNIANDVLVQVFNKGDYKKVILPMMVLRRLDILLEPTKEAVLKQKEQLDKMGITNQSPVLMTVTKYPFYNTSKFTMKTLTSETNPMRLKMNFLEYLDGYSKDVQDIIEKFKLKQQVDNLSENNRLGSILDKFTDSSVNLGINPIIDADGNEIMPGVDNHMMGTVFEELLRKFNEENSVTEAGEHFTPRDYVHLLSDLAIIPIADKIESTTYGIYDGASGTGGILTISKEQMQSVAEKNGKKVQIHTFGQEFQPDTYATCKADIMISGELRQFSYTLITSAYVCLEAFKNMIPKYLYYSLHSFDIKKVFYSMGGGLRQGLNYAELRKLNVIVPPKEEQQQIVEFIESRVAIIEELISIIKSEIEQMQEYKQCLISDAVTGKIKV